MTWLPSTATSRLRTSPSSGFFDHHIKKPTESTNVIAFSQIRCWNAVVDEELSKLSEDMHDGSLKEVPTVPFKDKIEELESVLQSISSMRSRLEEGLTVLEQAISNSVSTQQIFLAFRPFSKSDCLPACLSCPCRR